MTSCQHRLALILAVSLPAFLLAPGVARGRDHALTFRPEEVVSCLVEPSRRVALSSAVMGLVRHVRFERGDRVEAGAPLVELEADVERAQHDLAVARADFARRRLGRSRTMIANDMLSAHERDELTTELRIAELEAVRTRLELDRRITRSPVAGVLVDRRIQAGEYMTASPFAELVVLGTLHVELVLRGELYGRLHAGMQVDVELGAPVHGRRTARIAIVDPVIDPGSITFRARALLPNEDQAVPAGINCRPVRAGAAG